MLSFNSSLLQSRKCPILARISSYSEYKFIKASAGHRIRFTSHSIRSTDAIWTFVQFYRTDEFSWTNRHQEVHMCNEAIINEYMLCAHRKRLLLYRSNVSSIFFKSLINFQRYSFFQHQTAFMIAFRHFFCPNLDQAMYLSGDVLSQLILDTI